MASNKFKTLCKEEAYKNRLGKVITPNETITNIDNLSSIEITDSCISNNKIVGTAIAKTIKITTTENYELVDKEIDAQIGVLYDDTTTEYINVGKYTIDKENANNTSKKGEYNGLDLLKKLDTTYVCGIADLSKATIGDFWKDACNQVGLTPNETTFTNSNIVIGGNPFTNNETVKTVMQQVAEAGMYWVEIDNDTNKVKLNWFTNTIEETFTKSDYSNLEKNNTYGPINSLVVGLKDVEGENVARQDSASVTKVGENQFAIYDNYFLYSEELRNQAIDNLWNKIKGFTYINYSLTTYTGKPYLKRGSKISIEENDGTTFETYVLNHTFTYDGAFKSVISANSITNGETTNKNLPESASSKFKKVELKVDKVEGEISAVVEKVEDIEVDTTLTKEANGNPVVVTDAGPYKLESIKINGKSYQETRSGKNKLAILPFSNLSINGVTTNFDGETFTIKGTPTSTWYDLSGKYNVDLPIGRYLLSYVESTQTRIVLSTNFEDGTNQGYWLMGNSMVVDITRPVKSISLFTDGQTKDVEINKYIKGLMLEPMASGSTATDFEQYGASPSPDFPSEIKNVEGVENIFPIENKEYEYTYTSNYGSVDVSLLKTFNLKSGKHTMSFDIKSSNNKIFNKINLINPKGTHVVSMSIYKVFDTEYSKVVCNFTTTEDYEISKMNLQCAEPDTFYLKNFMLLEGTYTKENISNNVPYGSWLVVKSAGKNLANYNDSVEKIYNFNIGDIKAGKEYSLYLNIDGYINFNLRNGDGGSTIITRYDLTGKQIINFTANEDSILFFNNWTSEKGAFNRIPEIMLLEGTYTKETIREYKPYKENTALINLNKESLFNKDTITSGKSVSTSTGELYNDTNSFSTDYIFVKGLSNIIWNGYSNNSGGSWGAFYDIDKKYLSGFSFNGNTITIPTEAVYVRLGILNEYLETLKIYNGIETDDYYRLASISDVKDTFENGVLTQRIGKVVLDGSENWVWWGAAGYSKDDLDTNTIYLPKSFFGNAIPNFVNYNVGGVLYAYGMSSHFSYIRNTIWGANINLIALNSTENNCLQIRLKDELTGITSNNTNAEKLALFKTWLSKNPIELEYILATPIEHTLNYEVLELHEGYNNIITNDDLEPNMEITYLTDSKLNAKYATKGELKIESNSIKQSVSGEIEALGKKTEASLELKVDTSKYNDKEIVSMINASAEEINLKANRFSLESDNATITKDGVVDFVKGEIGKIEIGDNYLRVPISVKTEITQELIDTLLPRIMNGDTFTKEEIEMYDLNKDGKITNGDLAFMYNVIQYNITPDKPGYIEILSDEFKSHIAVIDGSGIERTKIGLTGITSNSVTSDGNDVNTMAQRLMELTNAMFFKADETFSPPRAMTVCGYITSSATAILFSIPVPKSLANVAESVTLNSLKLTVRHVGGGYVLNGVDVLADSSIKPNCYKVSDNMIMINITKSSAFAGATNNTPLAISVDKISATFN